MANKHCRLRKYQRKQEAAMKKGDKNKQARLAQLKWNYWGQIHTYSDLWEN